MPWVTVGRGMIKAQGSLWEVLGCLSSGAFGVYSVVVLGRCGLLVEASRSVSALLRVGGGGPSKA